MFPVLKKKIGGELHQKFVALHYALDPSRLLRPRVMEGLVIMSEKAVLMLDGGFVKKKLELRHKHFPTAAGLTYANR